MFGRSYALALGALPARLLAHSGTSLEGSVAALIQASKVQEVEPSCLLLFIVARLPLPLFVGCPQYCYALLVAPSPATVHW